MSAILDKVFELCDKGLMVHDSLLVNARAEIESLRSVAAERDELKRHLDALYATLALATDQAYYPGADFDAHEAVTQLRERIDKTADEFSVASICEAIGVDDRDERTASQIVNDAARLLSQYADRIAEQAAQLEQARHVISYVVETWNDDLNWYRPDHENSIDDCRAWLAANAPAPKSGGEDEE